MKRKNKATAAAPVVIEQNDVIVEIVTSEENSDVTIEAVEGWGGDITDDTATIDALLASADEPVVEPEVAEPVEPEVETVEALDLSEVEALIAEAETTDAPTVIAAQPKAPKAPKTPKVAAVVVPTRNFSDVAAMDKAVLTAQLVAPTTAKKIIEKAENLIAAVESGKKLSRYTSIATKALVAAGTVSGKSLVDIFVAEGLGLGTARSQAQQMTSLFKLTGLTSSDLVIADTNLANELAGMSA